MYSGCRIAALKTGSEDVPHHVPCDIRAGHVVEPKRRLPQVCARGWVWKEVADQRDRTAKYNLLVRNGSSVALWKRRK